jgi:hypothetical protein
MRMLSLGESAVRRSAPAAQEILSLSGKCKTVQDGFPEEPDDSDLHATLLQAGAGDAAAFNDGGSAERGQLASDQQAAAASTRSLQRRLQRVVASKAQSIAVLQAACGMLLDDELGSELH